MRGGQHHLVQLLMNEKNKNESAATTEFEKRVLKAKREAIKENKKIINVQM